jgi:tetratricopeptide (TPR) repeat protein
MTRRPLAILCLALLAATTLAAAAGKILLVARDLDRRPLPGLRFAYGGVESRPTNRTGATELDLPAGPHPGEPIEILVVPSTNAAEDWFLVNPQVNIPTAATSAAVVLMRRSAFRQVAAEARDAPAAATLRPSESTAEAKKRALLEAAARHGLKADQLETAIASFAETKDPKDRGIASYLKGQYAQAEELLQGAVDKKKSDLVEALRYLGASQYEQAKYRMAADNFGTAIALRGEDAELLRWLGQCRYSLAEWTEAEPLMRRTLAIDEKRYGPDHAGVGADLNNLAQLLQATNRLAESEPLMRRALVIAEKSFGPDHPAVATSLNNLAQLLQATNRLAEAEPLLRRALAIDEKGLGPTHPDVARGLNNLAILLQATDRRAEAEPLMRRALGIAENSFGPDHPEVAIFRSNLAQLLEATERFAEAEPLFRRALAIHEKSFGPDHPNVATALNNLAQLLQATDRLAEAEPLMRRALAIDEKSFGPDHAEVASDLNNLGQLLRATDRLAEAEPLLRRTVVIFLDFARRTGHEHPHLQAAITNYAGLLWEMGKSQAEIEAEIRLLIKGLK